jgi:Ala-tRNA(Pro) deacylase
MISTHVRDYLQSHQVHFETLPHSPAFEANEAAHALHISGKQFAKVIVVHADGRHVMVVLPAARRLNLHELRDALGVKHVQMVPESELEMLCSDCELGAFPPFGEFYGMEVWADRSLAEAEEIVFNAGTHTEAIEIRYADYVKLVHPQIARFAEPAVM